MKHIYQVLVLVYVCLVAFILTDVGEANDKEILVRQKRFLVFRNITHFFLRVNFKANTVPWNQIFAEAVGFRINWDDPPDSFRPFHHHRLHRRTAYSHLETLLDKNGLSGFHCVRRAICEMDMIPEPKEIYLRILKMVFRRQSSTTDKWHNKTEEDCSLSISTCPFSLLDVSRYTDIL